MHFYTRNHDIKTLQTEHRQLASTKLLDEGLRKLEFPKSMKDLCDRNTINLHPIGQNKNEKIIHMISIK